MSNDFGSGDFSGDFKDGFAFGNPRDADGSANPGDGLYGPPDPGFTSSEYHPGGSRQSSSLAGSLPSIGSVLRAAIFLILLAAAFVWALLR